MLCLVHSNARASLSADWTMLLHTTHSYHSVWSGRSRSTGNLQLTCTHVVDKMAQNKGKCLGLVRRASRFLDLIERATVYKSMMRSWMEYAFLSMGGASATTLSRLDPIQRQAVRIIGLPQQALKARSIQPLDQHRKVRALTLLHQINWKKDHALPYEVVPRPPTFRRNKAKDCTAVGKKRDLPQVWETHKHFRKTQSLKIIFNTAVCFLQPRCWNS